MRPIMVPLPVPSRLTLSAASLAALIAAGGAAEMHVAQI